MKLNGKWKKITLAQISILIFWVYSMKLRRWIKWRWRRFISILIFWVYSMKHFLHLLTHHSYEISILIFLVYSMKPLLKLASALNNNYFNPHFLSLFDETKLICFSNQKGNGISILIFWVYSMKQDTFGENLTLHQISILIFWVYSMKHVFWHYIYIAW